MWIYSDMDNNFNTGPKHMVAGAKVRQNHPFDKRPTYFLHIYKKTKNNTDIFKNATKNQWIYRDDIAFRNYYWMKWNQCCKPHRYLSQMLFIWNKESLNHYSQRLMVSFEVQFLDCGHSFWYMLYSLFMLNTTAVYTERWNKQNLSIWFWALMKKVGSVI